jgi:hypothetical protein
MDRYGLTVLGVVVCLAGPAMAETVCSFEAYTVAGPGVAVQIMDAPSADAKVLGIAPLFQPEGEDVIFGAEFTVTGMQDGWARVTNLTDWERGVTAPDGWINGEFIRFIAQTEAVFAGPDAGSAVVWESTDIWANPFAVHDCTGEWAEISFRDDQPQTVRGWVRGICGIQETTCDGVRGD